MDMNVEPHASSALANAAPISRQIWDAKYRLKDADGAPVDLTIEDSWRRVARALASGRSRAGTLGGAVLRGAQDFRFLPAGRILSGAGTSRRVTLFNCFVMGEIGDDLGSIFHHLREAALTMQQGGGIGYDFSTLRPKGAPVPAASAPMPPARCRSWTSGTACAARSCRAGSRRGAMMATMRCDHPDIEDFIAAKREAGRLRNFNLSVLVTDPFMTAVAADADWDLIFNGRVYRTIRARALFDAHHPRDLRLRRARRDLHRPHQRPQQPRLLRDDPRHQPLRRAAPAALWRLSARIDQHRPPGARPVHAAAPVDEAELAELVSIAVRMMDNTIDVSGFPLEEQRQEAIAKRRIGLGMTGLADALMMCGPPIRRRRRRPRGQGSGPRRICRAAYLASAGLAEEKGAFPLFDRDAYLAGETLRGARQRCPRTDRRARDQQRAADLDRADRHDLPGRRQRLVRHRAGVRTGLHAQGHTAGRLQARGGSGGLCAASLPGAARRRTPHCPTASSPPRTSPPPTRRMQAAVQRHVDSAISKTVNVPEDIGFEAFQAVYLDAYRSGCKGCTTYRPNAITGSSSR